VGPRSLEAAKAGFRQVGAFLHRIHISLHVRPWPQVDPSVQHEPSRLARSLHITLRWPVVTYFCVYRSNDASYDIYCVMRISRAPTHAPPTSGARSGARTAPRHPRGHAARHRGRHEQGAGVLYRRWRTAGGFYTARPTARAVVMATAPDRSLHTLAPSLLLSGRSSPAGYAYSHSRIPVTHELQPQCMLHTSDLIN
jgi:hypothetical protein